MRLAVATLLTFTTAAAHAHADADFGARGRVVLGAERLFGVVHREFRQGVYGEPGLDAVQRATTLTVVGGQGSPFYAFPRLGVDVFVAKGVSVGLSGGLQVEDDTRDGSEPGRLLRERFESTRWVIAPRVGFAYPLTSSLAIWARAGVTYLRYDEEVTVRSPVAPENTVRVNELRDALLAVTLEPTLVWKVVPRAAITLAGNLDFGVWGRRDVAEVDANPYWVRAKASEYGASIGILLEL